MGKSTFWAKRANAPFCWRVPPAGVLLGSDPSWRCLWEKLKTGASSASGSRSHFVLLVPGILLAFIAVAGGLNLNIMIYNLPCVVQSVTNNSPNSSFIFLEMRS